MPPRLLRALAAFTILFLLSVFTLDGTLRLVTCIFLGGLVVKTLIAHKAG
jgi:hypothetical protein